MSQDHIAFEWIECEKDDYAGEVKIEGSFLFTADQMEWVSNHTSAVG